MDAKIKKDSSNDIGIHIKGTVIKLGIHKKLLSILIGDIRTAKGVGDQN